MLPDGVEAIKNHPRPTNLRTSRRFLGTIGFYDWFIPNFSGKANVLHALKKKVVRFVWEDEHQPALEYLKLALCEAPVLQITEFQKEFVLVTDASDLSAVLHQRIDGELAPITYNCS